MTFYEMKLERIIKSLQDDLPNVKLCDTELCHKEVQRLRNKRDNLQYAKSTTIWKVGSDGLNKISQGYYNLPSANKDLQELRYKKGFDFVTNDFDKQLLDIVIPYSGQYALTSLLLEDTWLCFYSGSGKEGLAGFYTAPCPPIFDEVILDKKGFIEELINMGIKV